MVSIVVSLLFTMVMLLFAPFIASILGGSGNQYLIDYTKGIAVFQIAAYLSAFLMNSLQVVGDNKRAVISIVATAGLACGCDGFIAGLALFVGSGMFKACEQSEHIFSIAISKCSRLLLALR